MSEKLAELATLSERVRNLAGLIKSFKDDLNHVVEEQKLGGNDIARLQVRMDELEKKAEGCMKDLHKYDSRVVAYFAKVDLMAKDVDELVEKVDESEKKRQENETNRWKAIAQYALAAAGGGGVVGTILKLLGGS